MPQQVTWPSAEAVLTQPKWLVAGSVVIAACVANGRRHRRPGRQVVPELPAEARSSGGHPRHAAGRFRQLGDLATAGLVLGAAIYAARAERSRSPSTR